jgi:hypothetical protein
MNANIFIGMVVTPRDDNWAHWATFENVTSTPTGGGAGAVLEGGEALAQSSSAIPASEPLVAFSSRNGTRSQASNSSGERRQAIDNALSLLADVGQRFHEKRRREHGAAVNDGPREIGGQPPIEHDIVVEIFSDPVGPFGRLRRGVRI